MRFVHAVYAGRSAKFLTINGDPLTTDKSATACKADKFSTRCRNCIAVHPTELGDAFMVWIQAS
jgi:hypothetical protein